ncbi:tetratricopeptide repeat protein 4 isoform X2 [Zootermopsis nevadensis]|uniref:Tetratricopeptide repeat protein 4 n=3 Tax=Zootermopsis nevadensis TaxID=136037 RepID=A0A067R7Q2_ZOONE|nr:tetratricopeptide repeat protein 4 isoform X2 [Zootermopsis nevadensis]XP_021929520.1 tetratricopeptide repeat protein 4 isoform X2 [Zootermopsis nevadensis]KDR14373.1 Tetratricopeptide repeat protein 4 [Zootermopsis nevadensis]
MTMSNEERKKLAEKLDQELDEFIGGLEKRSYTEGWPEDRWEEEMEKHPFFMSKAPEAGEPLSPLMEGLQQLKYSETDNTPQDLAAAYKEDGNYNFKLKKYRLAIISYTEGLRQRCGDSHLESELYNNRAAAHFFLKNYRSCLFDCRAALKIRPCYSKAQARAAQCCMFLQRYDDCITLCEKMLVDCPTDKTTLELRAKAMAGKKIEERNARKQNMAKRKEEERDQALLTAIKERGIQIKGTDLSMSTLEPCSPMVAQGRVHLDDSGSLVWPVMFLYPEYQVTDFVQEFHEDNTFSQHLSTMFESPPEWDKDSSYILSELNIYYECQSDRTLHPVDACDTLGQVLPKQSYVVCGGTPCFLVTVRGSKAECCLLARYS